MHKYMVMVEILEARGWQYYTVDAESRDEAIRKFNSGNESVQFEDDEIEILDTDRPIAVLAE